MEGRARYMAGLDGLRAVAVLAVIAYHLNLSWAPGGLLGVGVFFVLSGYLITDLLLAERDREGHIELGLFWRRRARRLLPALWVMLGVVVLWVAVAQPARLPNLRGDVVAGLFYYSNWWYAVQHVAYFASFGPPSPLGHLWSLAIEEQFYLIWPLLLVAGAALVPRTSRGGPPVFRLGPRLATGTLTPLAWIVSAAVVSVVLMAVLWQPGVDPDRVYYGTDTRAFELLLGAALAFVWPSRRPAVLRPGQLATLNSAGVAGLIVIAVLVVVTTEYQAFIYRGGLVLLSLATVAVIAALAHPASWLGRALGVSPLRWLGVRSYGVYLWHYPVIVMTTPLVDTTGPHILRGLLQVGATVLIAALSWRFIEQPVRLHGFGVILAPLRTARWSVAGQPVALYDAAAAGVLLIGAAFAGLVGVSLPVSGTAPAAQLTTADTSNQTASDSSSCILPAPLPVALPPAPPAPPPSGAGVTAVGDSIMIDLSPFLTADLPGISVDGQVSRQMNDLQDLLGSMRSQGELGHQLIIELGTNGPFDESQLVGTLRSLGPMQRIVLVNAREPRPWESDVNSSLADTARQVPHTTVVDWYGASAGHPEYFFDDGVHPNPAGATVEAGLIAHALAPTPPAPPPRNPDTIHVMRCSWW
ncbi:MAG TPA: acyltransferase family protein [Candidatus Dormibacteraeota bacterium]